MLPIRPFKVVSRENPTDGLCRLVLEPDDGQPVFGFEAGQFVMLREANESGLATHPRAFSIASAPHESQERIELGVKAQGPLSQTLSACPKGSLFLVQGPYGTFTLNRQMPRIVFIAGGVGITPFRSQIREALLTGSGQEIVLFYSAQRNDQLLYHQEFVDLAAEYPDFTYVPILTRECPTGWPGECRRLDGEMLDKYLKDYSYGEFLLCGPASMMDGLRSVLSDKAPDLDKRIRFESY